MDDFDPARAAAALRALGGDTPMIRSAARRVTALEPWLSWLERELSEHRAAVPAAGGARGCSCYGLTYVPRGPGPSRSLLAG